MLGWNVSHSYVFFEIWRRRSAGYAALKFAVNRDWIAITSNGAVGHFETNQLLGHTALLLLNQGFTPDEIALLELRDPTQVGFEQCRFLVQFMAVKGIACFEAQGVACTEPGGD